MKAAELKVESLACIDSTTLSHSELLALSLSSLCAFDLRATNDLVTPKIDPALFNESAGSRRQTYSRPQSSPTGRRRRLAGLLPAPKLPPLPAHDPENAENRLIIDYLKQLIREDPKFDQVHLASPSLPQPNVKRKRGRKPKLKLHLEDCYRGIDILNRNGVAVDLSQLATSQDPFADELKRRTEGLSKEEELLGFLRDLPGQWGSRRKKRRIVDAADFGDVLPLSWKILLGLKRKDGRAWIYCRRYIRFCFFFLHHLVTFFFVVTLLFLSAYPIIGIPPCSPSGQHFVSCKEVSSYLQSLLGNGDAQSQSSRRSENVVQEQTVPAENVSTHFVVVVDFVKGLALGAFIEYKVHLQLTRESVIKYCDETVYVLLKTLVAILTVDFIIKDYYYCTLSSEALILTLEEANLFVKCYCEIYGLCVCAVVCWCHS